jgi:hypothetical protein
MKPSPEGGFKTERGFHLGVSHDFSKYAREASEALQIESESAARSTCC